MLVGPGLLTKGARFQIKCCIGAIKWNLTFHLPMIDQLLHRQNVRQRIEIGISEFNMNRTDGIRYGSSSSGWKIADRYFVAPFRMGR